MPFSKKTDFFTSEIGQKVREALELMATNELYNTTATYSANNETHPGNVIDFVDKHMEYLRDHPTTDPQHYISNLRLMTRKR